MADAPEKPRILLVAGPNGSGGRLILRAAEGRIVRIYEPPPAWMLPIVSSLQAQQDSA